MPACMSPPRAWSAIALSLLSASASADERRYAVAWHSATGCPGFERLHEQVALRSENIEVDEGASTSFQVGLSRRTDGTFVGDAALPDGSRRRVEAAECADVVDAIAFIVAVTLDPDAAREPLPGEAPNRQGQTHEAAGVRAWHSYLGATATLSGGRTPEAMPSAGLFLELYDEAAWLARSVKLSAVFGSSSLDSASGSASVRLFQGVLEACPLGISFASLCAGVEAGTLSVTSSASLSNEQNLRFSLAGRVGGQLRWLIDDAWAVEVLGGVLLPVMLDEYVVRQSDSGIEEVHEVGVSGYAGLAIGHRLD
jgi:hypothetical protein